MGVGGKSIAQSTGKAFDSLRAVQEITARSDLYAKAFGESDSTGLGNFYTPDARILTAAFRLPLAEKPSLISSET